MQIEPFLSRMQRNTSSSDTVRSKHTFLRIPQKNKTTKQRWSLPPLGTDGKAVFVLSQVSLFSRSVYNSGCSVNQQTFALKNKPRAEAHNTYWGGHSRADISICLCFSVPSRQPLPLWAAQAQGARAAFRSCLLLCSPISLSERSTWAQPPTWAKPVWNAAGKATGRAQSCLVDPAPRHLCPSEQGTDFRGKAIPKVQLITLTPPVPPSHTSPCPCSKNQLHCTNLQTPLQAAGKKSTLNNQVSNQ